MFFPESVNIDKNVWLIVVHQMSGVLLQLKVSHLEHIENNLKVPTYDTYVLYHNKHVKLIEYLVARG
jgi:hypothetical protein